MRIEKRVCDICKKESSESVNYSNGWITIRYAGIVVSGKFVLRSFKEHNGDVADFCSIKCLLKVVEGANPE